MTAKTEASKQDDSKTSTATPEASSEGQVDSKVDADSVAAFLRSNPDFFNEQQELLLGLSIPHQSGKAISLLERQVQVFRQRQEEMQEQFYEIINNARENDELFEKTRLILLELLRCQTLAELDETIASRLKTEFDADASRLVFICDQDLPQQAGINCLPSSAVMTALGELYQKQRTWCGRLNKVQQELLFPGQPKAIVSAAIVPLHLPESSPLLERIGTPLLLVGSTEEQHFNSSLDTLFLDFIGEVLTVHLQQLNEPAADAQD